MNFLKFLRKGNKNTLKSNEIANSNDFLNYIERGETFFRSSMWEKAIAEFEIALSLKTSDPGTRFKLAYCFLQLGMEERAQEEYNKAWEPYAKNKIVSRLIKDHENKTGESYNKNPSIFTRNNSVDIFPFERGYTENPEDFEGWLDKQNLHGLEYKFTPDIENYPFVLENLKPHDVVLDVGAGDLRFDILMAEVVRKVYAVEVNPFIIGRALQVIGYELPTNMIVVCGNIFDIEPPEDATVAVILMRHCTRKEELLERFKKLRIISCFGNELKVTKPNI